MSAALEHPVFDPAGAPISVLVDFDGTISLQDVGDELLKRHAPDQAEVVRLDRLYDAGQVGSRELITWDMEVLPRDAEVLLADVRSMHIDQTFVEFVETVGALGCAIEIVSDGVGFHVEPMLARYGLAHIPVATNRTEFGGSGARVTFPYGHSRCHVCGTCKRERIQRHAASGRAVVFVGDGTSDRYAANHADVVFAKGSLARWCEVAGIEYQSWGSMADVTTWLLAAVASDRLPTTSAGFESWQLRYRRQRAFICGPEVR